MLRRVSLSSVCGLLLLLSGCPKRQGPQAIVVYVPAPAPAPAPPAAKFQVMVIEQPPAPEPDETPPPQPAEVNTHHRTRHSSHTGAPTEPDEPPATETPETPEAPPAEVPALEPRQSSAQENELRREFLSVQQDVRNRLAKLSGAHLSSNDQKTLEDARTFFAQAAHAMESGDLPRALNLVRKAGLLLAALE